MASSRVSDCSLHQSQWTAGFIAGSVHVQVAVSCWYRTPSRNNPRTWEERDEQQKSANTRNRPVNHPRKNMGQGQNSYLEDRYVNIADLSLRFCVTPRCSLRWHLIPLTQITTYRLIPTRSRHRSYKSKIRMAPMIMMMMMMMMRLLHQNLHQTLPHIPHASAEDG